MRKMYVNSKVFYGAAALAAVLIFAAAGLGASLAHWSDTVSINGSASMGTLEWDVIPTGLAWNTNHVMRYSVAVRDNGDGPATGLVDVELDNAYPGAYGAFMLEVRNEGTIPVHVTFWVEAPPSGSCTDDAILNYLLLNPSLDTPNYTGVYDLNSYSLQYVSSGWTDPWTHSVSWWFANHGSSATALSIEDIMASGKILKLPATTTTVVEYDSDAIIMPGEKSVMIIWLGISDDLEQHEELMGGSCDPAFTIHYIATQALP